ncbi:MAG: flagellar biosynthesis protein FlhF [Clostridiales bacterium]|jgi:flagellar biosynthesis protein FlhF|nr:flagellar biosynthesis protein FlhF [Eubacteriales bacterium]MDH7565018.1 flagellar biosynthesis protein FlhF [Clostridiales bacterium]
MKIRRYIGKNAQEAILKVKMDLGNDAVILNTRKVRQKGLLKLFSKPMVEVLAAIDDDYAVSRAKNTVKPERPVQATERETSVKSGPDVKGEKLSELENKVRNMESLLQKIYNKMQAPFQTEGMPADGIRQTYPKVYQLFYDNLIKCEVEKTIAKSIVDQTWEKLGESAGVNDVASYMGNLISGMLGKPETIKLREDGKPTVAIFLGPTGVGKTTTLAKIAANYALNYGKNVGLITADTYRIAAVEQLKTYAEILGMPVSVIYSPDEIKDAIRSFSDKDMIFIDTAGRSSKNRAQFEELKSLLLAAEADVVYLVLSVTTSVRNCREILKDYSFLQEYKLIFTKLDETPVTGVILNAKFHTGKDLCYITTGQSVPDDIEIANVDKLAKKMLGSIL